MSFGRPYSPTDLASPLTAHLGEHVRIRHGARGKGYTWTEGVLANVHADGTATIAEDDIITEIVPVLDVLLIDRDGYNYRVDEHIGPWRMTFCCGASAKGLEDGIGCRSCYGDIEPGEDGPAQV